ncbi:MAG: NfeD family protein, partial [Kiritimatiellia bacterium]
AGISGILLLCWGLIQAMTLRYPGNPGELPGLVNVGNLSAAVTNLGLAVIGSTLLAALLLRSLGEKNPFGRRLVLADAIQPASRDQSALRLEQLVGQSGSALTPLRPGGTVRVDGQDYDAVSEGEFIESRSEIQVLDVRNHRLIVRSTPEVPA